MNKYYNAEKQKIYNKKYREENKEYIKNQKKKAYILLANKFKNSVPVICDCGAKIVRGSLLKHKKTQYHRKMMETCELFFV